MDGFYINLDRSTARRTAMEAQLQRLGMHGIRRSAAIDGAAIERPAPCGISAGELGCFLSHARAVAAPSADDGFRLVLEDDVELADDLPGIVYGFGLAQLQAYHLVFLDCQPYATTSILMTLWNCMQVHGADAPTGRVSGANIYDAADIYQWGATAYIVTPSGRALLPGLMQEALDAGPAEPYDMWLHRMIREQRLRAAVVAPFLATPALQSHEASTLMDRAAAPAGRKVHNALRRLFFAGPWNELEAYVRELSRSAYSGDPRLNLLADLMARDFVAVAQRNASSAARW